MILEVAKRPILDTFVTSQSCNKRACNNRRAINDYYGTNASHDEVWQFYRGIYESGRCWVEIVSKIPYRPRSIKLDYAFQYMDNNEIVWCDNGYNWDYIYIYHLLHTEKKSNFIENSNWPKQRSLYRGWSHDTGSSAWRSLLNLEVNANM